MDTLSYTVLVFPKQNLNASLECIIPYLYVVLNTEISKNTFDIVPDFYPNQLNVH